MDCDCDGIFNGVIDVIVFCMYDGVDLICIYGELMIDCAEFLIFIVIVVIIQSVFSGMYCVLINI